MQRRHFAFATALSAQRIMGANSAVRLAIVGCGLRGRYVAEGMRQASGASFVMTADAYRPNAAAAAQQLNPNATVVQDFRRVLENKDVDAILIATPDHWHATIAVLALNAGKHVYVEKPLAWSIPEGRAIVDAAARAKGKVCFTGTQHRSAPHFAELADLMKRRYIGDVKFVRIWNYVNLSPDAYSVVPDAAPPSELDWDLYLGPAPRVPYNERRFLGSFRQFKDYAGGTITDFGTHRFDTLHQIMGEDAPRTVSASGGRFSLRGAGDQPDVLQATFEYPSFVLSYEAINTNGFGGGFRSAGQNYYNVRSERDMPNGMAFYGTEGTIFAERVGFEVFPEPKSRTDRSPRIEELRRNATDVTHVHARHFVACIQEAEKPRTSAWIGHRATAIAHLGNIALRAGRKLVWDAEKETFPHDAEARQWLGRPARSPYNLI
jgi:predicted dehydrogenase